MKLLILGEKPGKEKFEDYFESLTNENLKNSSISTNESTNIKIRDKKITEWDSVYIQPEHRAIDYLRVLTEKISTSNINSNLNASFFIPFKKPYLMQVLSEKNVSIPKTASISTEKGLTELEKEINFPVIAKEYRNYELNRSKVIEEFEDLKIFSGKADHGESFVIIQEYNQKEVFEVLYLDNEITAIKPEQNPWKTTDYSIEGKYHSLSEKQKEIIKKAVNAIGVKTCRIRLNGDNITDMENRLNIERYQEESGKNIYKNVAKILKGENN